MSLKLMAIGAALLLAAAPATGQGRGTIEFGLFGNNSSFDEDLSINDAWGGGARVGAFILPWLSVEGDMGRKGASRPFGLESIEVEAFAARLLAVPFSYRQASLLVGAGVIHTDWQRDESDGLQALLGLKYDIGNTAAVRVDGLMDFNDNDTRNVAVQLGVSLYRHATGGWIGD